jgi:hypothetical protein
MAKVVGNPKITLPSDREDSENYTAENLHNLKSKVSELKKAVELNTEISSKEAFEKSPHCLEVLNK